MTEEFHSGAPGDKVAFGAGETLPAPDAPGLNEIRAAEAEHQVVVDRSEADIRREYTGRDLDYIADQLHAAGHSVGDLFRHVARSAFGVAIGPLPVERDEL